MVLYIKPAKLYIQKFKSKKSKNALFYYMSFYYNHLLKINALTVISINKFGIKLH